MPWMTKAKAGAGFSVGLGPVAGLLVNGEPEKRRFRLHFSVGQAF